MLAIERLWRAISDPIELLRSSPSSPDKQDIPALVEKARELRHCCAMVGDIVDRIDIMPSEMRITLDPVGLGRRFGMTIDAEAPALFITTPATLRRSGLAMRVVLDTGDAATSHEPDARLIGAIARAHRWWNRLLEEPNLTITDLARSEGVTSSCMTRVIRLTFLAPMIVTRIVEGKSPQTSTSSA